MSLHGDVRIGAGSVFQQHAIPELRAYCLQDIEEEGRITKTTCLLYECNSHTLVLPEFGSLALREIGVAR